MKKILILLYMMMCCAIGIVQAQTIYVNTPDTVCISTASSTAGQTKYLSVNAMVVTSNRYKVTEQASWAITGPTASAADYEVLYTGNTSAVTKADKLTKTKSLTLQFLVPGTYTLTITLPYTDNGVAKTSVQTKKIVAMDCTISTCGSNEANDKPGFFEDFGTLSGSGIVRRPYPINGVVTYDYQGTGDLADNYYSISNNTQLKGDWVNNTDHTGNSRGGMLVANSAYEPRRFYQKTVTGLCKGSVYNFSAWLININPIGVFESGCVSGYRYAGVTFQVVNAANPSQILANFPTYNVSMDLSAPQGSWQKYGGSFTVPSNIDSVKVLIINNKPGGCGNDIAIDDIEFAYCSPTITASIKGKTDNLAEVVCEGAPITLTSNFTPANYFVNPAYQWEMSDDEGLTWINVPFGTNTSKDLVIGPGQLKGTRTVPTSYRFRVRIYETGSDAVTCASPSEYVRLTILPMPTLYLTKSQVCAGAYVELQASGGFDRFTWRDLPGYVGATRTIQVKGDTTIMVYGYVDYADGHTCVDSNTAFIKSVDKPVVDVISTSQNICAGSSVDIRINDALAGNTINWYQGPDAGGGLTLLPQYDGMTELVQVQINNAAQGVFTVVVKDPTNTCQVQSAPFTVNVTPVPVANAGPDQMACASINTTGNFTMAALLNSGESGVWTIDTLWGPGADPAITAADFKNYASIQFPNLAKTRVTLKKGGITVRFKWTVKATANTSCSSSDFVEVTLLYDPTFSDAGRDTTLCATNVFTMNASRPDGTLTGPYAETGTWKLVSGNATIANINAYNTTVTSNVAEQDIVLTWSITNAANCTPSIDTVVLHKTTRPVITLKPSIITCNTSGTFSLDTLSTKGNPDTYSITAGTPALPGFTAITDQPITAWPIVINYPVGTARGVYNFNLSYKNSLNAGCDSTVPFSVSVETPPVAPTGIAVGSPNICTSGTSTLSVVGGSLGTKADGTPNGTWVWYAGGCGVGAPIGTGTSITVAVSATTTYYVRAETTGACSNTTCASATVTVYQAPNPAAAGPDQTKCNTTAFTMAANAASVGTGTWTLPAGSTATITAGQANSPTAVINVPAGVTVTATWTITNGACTTSDQVILKNDALPTATAGPNQTKCNTTAFTMAANTPAAGQTGTWTLPGGTTATITAGQANSPTAVINVPAGVSVVATWTVVNGTCSVSSTVTLKNDALPTATAGPNQTKCNTTAFVMAANTPAAGQTGTWTLPGGTTATITAGQANSPTATINVPVGVSVVATWTVVNGTCSVSSTVTLKNDAPPTTPNAGADQTKCNNTAFTLAANAPTVGTGAWSVVSSTPAGFTFPAASVSNPTAAITVPVGSTVTLRWTITNGTCVLTDDVVLTNDAPPTTAAAGADQAKCNTPSFTLAANAPTVGTGAWSVVSSTPAGFTFPAASVSNPTATITVPAGTTVTLRWTTTNGTCTSTDDVILTNSALPTTPNAGADQTKCNTPSFTLAANAPTVGTGAWSVVSSTPAGFTFPAASVSNPTATITVPAGTTVTLRWTITNGTCVLTDDVILKNDAAPTTAAAGADQSKCNTPAFTLAANAPTVGTGAWSVVSSTPAGFTFPAASVNNPTAAITVPAGTTVTLRWTITNGTCSSTDDVTLINYVAPTAANAGADQTKCNTTAFTMAANAASVGTGLWTLPAGSTATITAGQQNSPTAVINVPAGVTVTATWTITNGVCTTSDQVVLTNDALPTAAAGPDQTKCNTTTFTMAANTPAVGTGTWTLPAGSTATITAGQANSPTAVINVPAGVTVTATWTVVNGSCSVSDAVVLKNDALPTAAAGPDQTKCNTTTFTMAANTPAAGQTGTWTLPGGTTATITAGQANSPTAVINVPVGVSVVATWTVVNGTCSVSDAVTLKNDAPPTTPAAGADQTKCNTSAFTLAANAPTVGTGAWSVVSSTPAGFTFPAASVNNPTAAITVPAGTTVTLRWTITNGTCSLSDDVVLKNDAPPTTAAAGADQTKCNTPSFTLAANAPTVGTGAWSVVSSTPAGFTFPAASVNNPTATITVPAGTTVTLRWTTTNGTCSTTDDVTLINNALPTTPAAGADQTKCNTPSFTLAANAPTVGTGAWSVVSSTPAGFTFPAASVSNPTATITVPAGTTVTLRWTITNGTCVLTDDVILTNDAPPTTSAAGADQSKCNTPAFTLAANAPTVGTGAWSVVSSSPAGFTFPAASVNNPTAAITVPAGTTVTLRWTITNGTCSSTDDVTLINYVAPTAANAGADQSKCNTTAFTMAANAASVGTGTWTLPAGSTATITAGQANSPTAVINVPAGTSVVATWTITNGVCTTSDQVTLTNDALPTATAGPNQTKCNTTAFTMAANTPAAGQTGTWTLPGGTTATITAGQANSPTAVINVPAGVSVVATWTVVNGTCSVSSTVTLKNDALPTAAAGPDQTKCNTPAFTMAANAPAAGQTGTWTLPAGTTATITAGQQNNPAAVINVPAGVSVVATWTVVNGTCSVSDAVTLTNDAPPTTPAAGADQTKCNTPSFTLAANAPTVGTGAWSVVSSTPAGFTFPAASVNNPAAAITVPAGTTVTLRWTITNGTCSLSDDVVLTNDAPPTTAAAGADQENCNNPSFTLAANAPTVGTGKWSVVSSTPAGFTFPAASVSNPTAAITVPAGTTVTLRWTITNGSCTSTDDVTLINNAQPTTPAAGADQEKCNTPSFTLAANAPTVGTGAWSVVSSTPAGFTFPAASVSNPTATITVPAGTTVTLRWTITNGTCTLSDDVTLTNDAAPAAANAGPDQQECNNTSTFTLAANAPSVAGATGTWTVVSPASFTFPAAQVNNPTASLSIPAGTVLTLRWTITNGVCTTSDDVVLTNFQLPDVADAGPDQAKCAGTDFVTAANTPTVPGAVGTWTVISGAATIKAGEENLAVAHITVANGATAVLRWTIKNGLCENFDEVSLTNFLTPSPANAGPDQRDCNIPTFIMTANAPDVPGATGTWTLAAGSPGTITPGDENKPNAVINVPTGATVTAIWTITNGTCPSVDTVLLTNDEMPSPAAAGPDQEKCNTPAFTMAANVPSVGVGKWSLTAGTTASFAVADSTNPNAVINVPAGVTVTATWTITNGTCVTSDDVILTNYAAPAPAAAGPDQENCNTPTFTMAAAAPSVGVGKWSLVPGSTASFAVADSTNRNAVINVPAGQSAQAIWTITNGVCSTADTVKLTNYVAPAPAAAGPDQAQCNTTTFTMAANTPSVGVGKWSLPAGSTASFAVADSTNPNAVINVPAGVTVTATWTITNGVCTTSDAVMLTNNALPTANAGADQTKCNTTAFAMAANTPAIGTGTWTLPAGSTATITAGQQNSPTAVINVPAGVTVTATWTVVNGTCTVSDDVVLQNDALPTANAGADQTKCNTPAFTMAANAPAAGQTGTWTLPAGTTATITAGQQNSPTAVINVPAGVTVTATWTVVNGTCSVSDAVILKNDATPTTPNAGVDQTKCNTPVFTLAANVPTVGTGAWSVVSSTPAGFTFPAASVNNPTAAITVPVGATVTLRWTITNGTCSLSDDVVLKNDAPPTTAAAGADQTKCNTPSFTLAANAPTVGTGAWSVVSSAPAGFTFPAASVNNPTATITVPAGTTVTLRWTTTNGICTSTDDVVLTNNALPTTPAAGPDQAKCNTPSFTLAANAPTVGTGAWSVVSSTPAGFTFPAAGINNPTATITINAGTTVTLRWTITNGTCVATDDVVLTNYVAPAPAAAGADQEKCATPTFTMAAAAPSAGVGKWSLVPGSTASFAVADSTNRNAVINVPAGQSAQAIWTITNGVCSTADTVKLTNYVAPAPAAAGPDQAQCNTPTFTMAANTPSVGVGKWSLPAGSTASFAVADSTNPNAVINVPAGVTVTATWTIRNGVCTTTDNVTLTNYQQPTAAAAGPDQEQCNTPGFRMAANAPSVGVGKWSLSPGTTASFAVSDSTNPNAAINVPAGVTVIATWTIRNGTCVTSDDVVLTNYAQPTAANAGGDMTHCDNDRFVMAANTPSVGTGTWSLPAGTTASIAATDWNNPNAVITVPAGVTVTATWTIKNGTCTTSDNVILTNHQMPANAAAGADQTHCDDPNFTMSANTPSPVTATGTWTIVSGTATIADIHSASTRVTVPAGGTVTLRWTITNGTCTSTPDEVVLTNQGAILGNTITADQLLCANQTPATLQGATLSGGNGTFTYQWQVSTTNATTGFVNVTTNGTNATFTPPMITQNTWYRRVVMSGACTGNISNAVMLTLMNVPPVVISVPGPLTVDCVQGTDYTTKFGTPVFSHAPYNNEPLTVTHNDVTVTVDACTFTIMRTWTATDRCGLTTQAQQTITVVDRTAPVFTGTAPANITVECDKVPVAVTLTANDACTGAMTITPIEVRVDQPGACASNYQLIRKWVAVDACGNASDTLRQVITVRDMTPPVFSNPAPANITVDCDKVPAGQPLTATDNCTPGTITVTPVDVRKNISGSRCTDNYQIIRTWTATDLCGNKTVLTQTITVQDTIKPRFSMSLPPAITVDCDKVPAVAAITATDNCTVSVAVKVSEKKEFLSSVCASNYRLTRTWTATDNCGNTATMQQVITVQDTTRPVFTVIPPADTTVSCDAVPAPPTNLKATDNCSAVKISYTQTRETIAGACASNYRLIRIWTAKDQCNNTATIQQVITVTDTTKPVIDPAPANVTLNCGDAIPVAATLYARDNCDATFPKKATMTQDPFTVDLCAGYTITRRWTISDACGNAAIERVQTITVNPCPKPALDPQLPANCSDNTKFAVMLQNKVNRPKFTLVSVVPATAVSTPLTQSSNVFDLNGATQATFIVTDGVTGCVSDPITYDLQYVTKPVVDLGADVAICQGSSITLDAGIANAAYGIRWSTGATTQTIDVTTAGTYTVTVSNGICTTTDAINVTVNMPPVVNIPDTAICEGQSVKLNAYVQGATYVWSTGETTASIMVNMTGTYSVDVTLNGCTTHEEATVTVGTPPAITLTDDTEMCPNETLMLTVEPDGGSVRWSTGETTNSIVVTKAGTYEVTVTRDGCVVNDQVTVTERPDLDIDLGPDREFCTGGRVVLDASNPDAISYLWNDGETTPVREIVMPGKYVVSVMDRFCSRITMDSVNVTVAGIPETLLGRDTTLCIGEDLTLKVNAGAGNTIRWQDGSTGSTYKVTGPGIYTVTVSNECGSVSDQIAVSYKPCEAEPHFPTGFTPNGDGHNDIFKPVVRGPMYDYDLRIYNRWGELIFLSKDQKTGWDGRYKGVMVENGTYVWMLTYKKVMGGAVNIVKGEVTAIR